jgi:hypothetical protein
MVFEDSSNTQTTFALIATAHMLSCTSVNGLQFSRHLLLTLSFEMSSIVYRVSHRAVKRTPAVVAARGDRCYPRHAADIFRLGTCI